MEYKKYTSILTIQTKYKGKNNFSFTGVAKQKQLKTKWNLKSLPNIWYMNKDANFLFTSINGSIKSSLFPSYLKFADMTPLDKKGRKDAKQNYRPLSI